MRVGNRNNNFARNRLNNRVGAVIVLSNIYLASSSTTLASNENILASGRDFDSFLSSTSTKLSSSSSILASQV